MKFIHDLISNNTTTSSARIINILGAITTSFILVWDSVNNSAITSEAFGMYLAYCAGVYSYSKKLDNEKESK